MSHLNKIKDQQNLSWSLTIEPVFCRPCETFFSGWYHWTMINVLILTCSWWLCILINYGTSKHRLLILILLLPGLLLIIWRWVEMIVLIFSSRVTPNLVGFLLLSRPTILIVLRLKIIFRFFSIVLLLGFLPTSFLILRVLIPVLSLVIWTLT